jgi:hypothetical protein
MANSGVAVAFAQPGSSDSTKDPDSSVNAKPTSPNQDNPLAGGAYALRATLHGLANVLGFDHPRTSPVADSTNPATSTTTPIVPDPSDATSQITRTFTGVVDNRPAAAAPTNGSDPVTPQSDTVPPSTPATPVTDTPPPASTPPPFDLVPPAANLVTAAQNVVTPVATQLAAIPGLAAAPIADVLTSLQNVITATNDALAPLTQLPTDLASLFPVTATQPVVTTVDSRMPTVTAGVTLPSPVLTVQALTQNGGAPTDVAAPVVTAPPATPVPLDTAALATASSEATTAQADPQTGISEGLQAFFQAYGTLIIAASLSALFGAALPGILGILVPTLAGLRIGYRQAKAGTTLRASDIARFAGSGPVGIVRTGSLIAFRPRAARVAEHVGAGSQRVA